MRWREAEPHHLDRQDSRDWYARLSVAHAKCLPRAEKCVQRGPASFLDPKRQGSSARGVVLARWGGMGNHRYQVGFSGDVAGLTWDNLAYQPYFSMTGTNVGYGFWSHDIEGG